MIPKTYAAAAVISYIYKRKILSLLPFVRTVQALYKFFS